MFYATQAIRNALLEMNLKISLDETDKASVVKVLFPLKCRAPVEIRFISTDNDNDVAVRVDLMRVGKEQTDAVLTVLNKLNRKYRYAKFTLNSEDDVTVEYDMPIKNELVGETAKEILERFLQIIQEAHPEILRAALDQDPLLPLN